MADRPGVKPVSTSDERNTSSHHNEESNESGMDEQDLDEQQCIVNMAFDGESKNKHSNECDDKSSSSSSKVACTKENKKPVLPTHCHRTPPCKAKEYHPMHMDPLLQKVPVPKARGKNNTKQKEVWKHQSITFVDARAKRSSNASSTKQSR